MGNEHGEVSSADSPFGEDWKIQRRAAEIGRAPESPLLGRSQAAAYPAKPKSSPPSSSFHSDSSNLDIIRATAVLSVFFAHLHTIWTGKESMIGWHFSQMGVLVFFVHTSMVLMLSNAFLLNAQNGNPEVRRCLAPSTCADSSAFTHLVRSV